ncbi:EamA family transporter RarD [Defluviimonas sp. WL0002]|uniref:EamA family transporter RarD n=1 Tax=Albidovulum marisflavi TaxID=2984159 RepID=A0ABT2ZCZ3_9RHOB|nr:EamA family transporter RarD [Defluviimonas sp. WL0002]MCV2868967.1 EamA family transporter RarD [Defluviimonas sp. WL0002]
MTAEFRGIAALIAACTVWGLSPIYYKALSHVPPLEVLTHRALWSLALFSAWLGFKGRLGEVRGLLAGPGRWLLALAAFMIGINWFGYISAIQAGRTVEASLGYYIFPLIAVLLGVMLFGEPFARAKGAAVALAAAAVILLTWGLGAAPWIALFLGGTFAIYAAIKKRLGAGPVVSITVETLMLAPLALFWLWHVTWTQTGHFGDSAQTSVMLVFSGVITAVPLMLFSYASRQVSMAAFGLTQYLNPTLQFLCATVVFQEPFTGWHLAAFALIWTAVAIFSLSGLKWPGRAGMT